MAEHYYKIAGVTDRHGNWADSVITNSGKEVKVGAIEQLSSSEVAEARSLGFIVEDSSKSEKEEYESQVASSQPRQAPAEDSLAASPLFDTPLTSD